MANITQMQNEQFESRKNLQAGGYTAVICILLLVVFLFVRWTLPPLPEIPQDEGIEVNLGNSDAGLGDEQPFLPGQPSPQDQQAYTPPKVTPTENVEAPKDVETD